MRILLVNTSETIGGAAIAANRLLRALQGEGAEVQMLVRDKQTDNPAVLPLPHQRLMHLRFIAERLGIYCWNGLSRDGLWAIDSGSLGADITRLPAFRNADVVHLHWTNQGMLSLSDIRAILRSGKPVVWTLHDMWPFTGTCHHAATCTKWTTGCHTCPKLHLSFAHDLSSRVWKKKMKVLREGRLAIVGCSNWITDLARQSPFFDGRIVESIPNALPTRFFAPQDRLAARRRLGLPTDRRLVLFVAYKATDPYKGIYLLKEACSRLTDNVFLKNTAELVAVGKDAESLRGTFPLPVHTFNYISDPATMAALYAAADVLVAPTLQDNLPNTIAEAMACGTPVVGFRVGGLPQMIDDGVNGRLVCPKDSAALGDAIADVLTQTRQQTLSDAARAKALACYAEPAVAQRYLALYERLISGKS